MQVAALCSRYSVQSYPSLIQKQPKTMSKKYLLSGDDEYKNQEFINGLKSQLDPSWLSLNYHEINLKSEAETPTEDKIGLAIACIRQIPLGLGGKLVVIKGDLKVEEPEENNGSSGTKEKRLALTEELIFAEEENTTVILVCNPDKRTRIGKLVTSAFSRVEFTTIPNWKTQEIAEVVGKTGSDLGLNLPCRVSQYIAEAVGNKTMRIGVEVEKLVLYRGEEKLTLTEVKQLIPSIQHNSIELSKLIKDKKGVQTRELSEALLKTTQPVVIVAALTTIWSTWTRVKAALAAEVTDDKELQESLEIKNPGRLYYLKLEVERVSLKRLMETTIELFELEISLKSGLDPKALPEKLMKLVMIKD
ncbi:MAG TPA: hypothetical protein DCP31_06560 [Cyanobacteria bacterium UBA8543]|nr:hypothetical protein [Cyanobacteria bacterium UBA8543]